MDLMTVEEAAAAIHATVKPSSVRRAIREGRLDAKMIFGRYYITPEALQRFVKCPEKRSRHASGSAETARGSSSNEAVTTGQAMVQDRIAKLRRSSPRGSQAERQSASARQTRAK